MSEPCDGCQEDASHFLCENCLDNEGRDEEQELLKEAHEALRLLWMHTAGYLRKQALPDDYDEIEGVLRKLNKRERRRS